MSLTDHTQLSLSQQKKLVDSLKPEGAQAYLDALAKMEASVRDGDDDHLSALQKGHGFEDQFKGRLADRFFHAAALLSECAHANAGHMADARQALKDLPTQLAQTKKQCQAKFAELDEAGGADGHPQLAKLVRQEVGQWLNTTYDQMPKSLPQFEPPQRPVAPTGPVDPTSLGQPPTVPAGPPPMGPGGGQPPPSPSGSPQDALAALKKAQDPQEPTDAAAAAQSGQPQTAGQSDPSQALGQLGQGAGQAGQGAGQAAGQAGQLAQSLAGAFKPQGAGDGLGEGTDAAATLGEEDQQLPDATTAAAAIPFHGGASGPGSSVGGPSARSLANAPGHSAAAQQPGAPSAPTVPASAQNPNAAAGMGPGMMPMSPHGQQQGAGLTRGGNKYLRNNEANKETFVAGVPVVSEQVTEGDGTVGALTEAERTAQVVKIEGEELVDAEAREFR